VKNGENAELNFNGSEGIPPSRVWGAGRPQVVD